ncbi:hypothetical protein C8A00DRAFT_19422 [Chaetomidium leptoderma]|uniref:Zn(2)-C6 fungal-type domain-containing protein n=1 Tax=Chaetomidium leptoderma TaxID=669021 RepID=A0AAN6VDD2_9PEZI|nr:hypothetical protein C8A00DRAFT_19422 [Chaetomidium leptoderma]
MPRQHLTPNACLVCRKKRTKCDGQQPCRRCRLRGEECAYEDKKWRTKDHLRSEIERLRTEQRQGHALLRALTNNDPERWDMVLGRMRAGDPPETIAEWILVHSSRRLSGASSRSPRASDDDTSAAAPSRGSAAAGTSSATPRRFSFDPQPSIFPPGLYMLPPEVPRRQYFPPPESLVDPIPHTWTKVTSDTRLVQRLLTRFFASSLPYLSLVSQRHFIQDFREGKPRYCSEALVNAVLGMACKAATAASQLVSRVSFGDAFMGEAKGLLAKEKDHVNLPCVQALGVLAMAEMAQGNEEEASDLARGSVKACIRLILQTQQRDHELDDDFKTVRALAYCGGFSLIRVLRLLTGDLEPKTGPLFMRMYPDTGHVGDDNPEARVERGISLQVRFFTELQYCPPLARFIFEVTEAAHTFSSYNYSKAMTASDLDGAFNKCIRYHREATDSAVFNSDAKPDTFLAHIWYNFCLLSLLQPFVTSSASLVDGLPSSLSGDATPRTVCQQASEAIISLTSTYQTRCFLSYLPPLLPYMVFAAVLHQRSLITERHPRAQLVGSPEPLSPGPMYDPSYSISSTRPNMPQAGDPFATTEPSSPTLAMQTPRSAGRRNSVLSASSTCFSTDDQARRPSICSFSSGTTSDMDDPWSPSEGPDTQQSDALPTFTSQPADLVTIGSLQLASMGAQHPGAAEAAHLLRTASSTTTRDAAGGLNLYSMPILPPGVLDGDSGLPVGLGLGLQTSASPATGGCEATPTDSTRGSASTSKLDYGVSIQPTERRPRASFPDKIRQPPAQLLFGK